MRFQIEPLVWVDALSVLLASVSDVFLGRLALAGDLNFIGSLCGIEVTKGKSGLVHSDTLLLLLELCVGLKSLAWSRFLA